MRKALEFPRIDEGKLDAVEALTLPAQRALLDKWSRLTPGQQSSLLALMDAMLEK